MKNRLTGAVIVLSAVVGLLDHSGAAAEEKSEALDVFEQRIMPIFRSTKPSSCVQCHLSSVDLKNYILPSSEKTFLSLRDQGLIDLESPTNSKILKLIGMGERDKDRRSRLIHAKTRKAEYEAFAAWIEACCKDDGLVKLPRLDAKDYAKPAPPDKVIRHNRKSRVLDSFVRNIWSQRMRCFPCHTPNEIQPNNPRHKKPAERHKEYVKLYGQRMNIFKKTPEQTMQQLVISSRRPHKNALPLINIESPAESLLVLKPTSKVPPKGADGKLGAPSSQVPVSHIGGLKMHRDDQSYKSFLAWLQDYSNVVKGHYSSGAELPSDNWFPTQFVLMLTDAPKSWATGVPVQSFLYRWNPEAGKWSDKPIAFTQGPVNPRGRVNGALFLLAPEQGKDFQPRKALPRSGKFLLKIYVDHQARIAKSPAAFLPDEDLAGQLELDIKNWKPSFKTRQMISVKKLDRP